MAPKRNNKQATKRTLKFLASNKDHLITKRILHNADKQLIKHICNAAYNVTQGDVPLTPHQKRTLKKFRPVLASLTTRDKSLQQKQKQLQTGGAFPIAVGYILPTLLSAVLSTVGSVLFNK